MSEKINPTMPIPMVGNPIPDEEREITIAKSNIAIPNPIFSLLVLFYNPDLSSMHYSLKANKHIIISFYV